MSVIESWIARRARSNVEAFAEFCLRDERSGAAIQLAPHHRAMVRSWLAHDRTVSLAPSEFAKSTMAAAFIAWRIGRDPSLRVGLLSATREQAVKLLRLVAIVMSSPNYRKVFPIIGVDRHTQDELIVSGRPDTMKDPNVLASGLGLSSMLGSRFDLAILDDAVNRDRIKTQSGRDAEYQDCLAVTVSRVAPGGEIHAVNTAEHSDDVVHRLARLPGWQLFRYPALDEQGRPTWPERWPIERIEARRLELGPVAFKRAMLCEPIDAASLVFSDEDVAEALRLGNTPHLDPSGARCVIGVDPAWTTTGRSDLSGIVLVAIDDAGYRYVSHVEGVKLNHDRLADRVVELARANRAVIYCESNGAGAVIASIIGKRAPCKPLHTSPTSKRARVEALSAELASRRWCFRNNGTLSPNMRALCDDLLGFSFEGHMGDRLSALLLACEGARLFESRPKGGWRNFTLPGGGAFNNR